MKPKVNQFLCEGCAEPMPLHGSTDGWFTVIRAVNPGTKTIVFCPSCYQLHYNAQAEAAVSTSH